MKLNYNDLKDSLSNLCPSVIDNNYPMIRAHIIDDDKNEYFIIDFEARVGVYWGHAIVKYNKRSEARYGLVQCSLTELMLINPVVIENSSSIGFTIEDLMYFSQIIKGANFRSLFLTKYL